MDTNITTQRWRNRIANFLWYQAIWFSAVLGGDGLLGLAVLLLVIHLYRVHDWQQQALLMLVAGAVGGSIDALLTYQGVYAFATDPISGGAPLWLFVIWMGFAGTLRHSLAWLAARPRLMVASALFGAPLAYSSAARLGAVEFPLGQVTTLPLVALTWLMVMPVLLSVNRWLTQRPDRQRAVSIDTANH